MKYLSKPKNKLFIVLIFTFILLVCNNIISLMNIQDGFIKIITIISLLLIVFFSYLLVRIVIKGYIRPLRSLTLYLESMEYEESSKPIAKELAGRDDEVGVLAEQITNLINKHQQKDIDRSSSVLENIKSLLTKMQDLDNNIGNIAATTQELSATMEETSALSTDIASTSLDIAGTVQDFSEKAQTGYEASEGIKLNAGSSPYLTQNAITYDEKIIIRSQNNIYTLYSRFNFRNMWDILSYLIT